MSATPLVFESEDGVAILTFNRPDKLNALSSDLLREFDDRLRAIAQDAEHRVLILTGAGEKAFVAGADIDEYSSQTFEEFVAYQQNSRRLFSFLDQFPKPVLGAVNGYALGGGFEIALCCDVLVASASAEFGLPEGLLGLSPGGGGTQRLARAVGRHVAAQVLLGAERLIAARAAELGLVAEVTEPEKLREVALEWARRMMRVGPLAAKEMKRLVRQGLDGSLELGLSLEQEVLFRLYHTEDAREGITAFVEKRKPDFRGR
jgi:enoyl-CoA hydratase